MPKKILITAGPTREPIDPVRYLSNYSTGTFGYLIAENFHRKGYDVCLVTGPTGLVPPEGVEIVPIETAEEMREEVLRRTSESDCLIMAAAVADFKPKRISSSKIKKNNEFILELEKTSDILTDVAGGEGFIKIGFALETEDPIENGKEKLRAKDLDMIIVNVKDPDNDPFGQGKKRYFIISKEGSVETFDKTDKSEMAEKITEKVSGLIK